MREIIFRGRSKETGEWHEGNYHHNTRRGVWHGITSKDDNTTEHIYRESLQILNESMEWEDI